MPKIDLRRFEPLPDRFFETEPGLALLDELADARPWRRGWGKPFWWYLCYLRRGQLSLHTLTYLILAVREPWAVLVFGLGVIVFELKIVPRAMDLRLDDREFVKLVLTGRRFELRGGKSEARRILWVFLFVWLSGVVVGVPLWWLARLHALGRCSIPVDDDLLCRFAEPGMTAFALWLGLLTLGPVVYTSLRFPMLHPTKCPEERDDHPTMYSWTNEGYGRWIPALPRTALHYIFPPGASFFFFLFAAAFGAGAEAMLGPFMLMGAVVMGGLMPLVTLKFQPEFKGWSIVRAYLETAVSHRRNAAQDA